MTALGFVHLAHASFAKEFEDPIRPNVLGPLVKCRRTGGGTDG
jgi:hypothetical protein